MTTVPRKPPAQTTIFRCVTAAPRALTLTYGEVGEGAFAPEAAHYVVTVGRDADKVAVLGIAGAGPPRMLVNLGDSLAAMAGCWTSGVDLFDAVKRPFRPRLPIVPGEIANVLASVEVDGDATAPVSAVLTLGLKSDDSAVYQLRLAAIEGGDQVAINAARGGGATFAHSGAHTDHTSGMLTAPELSVVGRTLMALGRLPLPDTAEGLVEMLRGILAGQIGLDTHAEHEATEARTIHARCPACNHVFTITKETP